MHWSTFILAYSTQPFWIRVYRISTSLFHSSLQNCSRSVQLWEDLLCTAIFKSFRTFFTGFRCELWLGHSKTFNLFLWKSFLWFVLWVVIVLEGQLSNLQILCENRLVFGAFYGSFYLAESPSPSSRHHASTTMLHWRYGALWVMSYFSPPPNLYFNIMPKMLLRP